MKKKNWEPYTTGAIIAGVWQLIFLNLGMGAKWGDAVFIAFITGLVFFLVAVFMFEVKGLKGNL